MPRPSSTLSEVAYEPILIEKGTRGPAPEPFATLRDPSRNPFLRWWPDPTDLYSFLLRDVILNGTFELLTSGDVPIRDTGYLLDQERIEQIATSMGSAVKLDYDGIALVGCNTAFTNHFHWISQAIPAIYSSMLGGRDRILALPPLNDHQEESLELLGNSRTPRITLERKKAYMLPRAEYNRFLNGGGAFAYLQREKEAFQRMAKTAGQARNGPRRIYVARTDASRRRMVAEDDLIRILLARGFHIVTPGVLSFAEQVRLFAGANLVVGIHGAGLTNIVFCHPGTLVYEILPAHYTNACFCNLAYNCGLRYWADAFESEGTGVPVLRDWNVDLAFVQDRLTEMEFVAGYLGL
jgi:capsular polysaccharide biosynthesis protein